MKLTRPDGSVIEGSPSEIVEYEALLRSLVVASNETPVERGAEVDWEFVSTDVGFRALTRIKLGKEIKAILTSLYRAEQNWTTAKDLQKLIDYTPPRFAGLMGAFGRRIGNTPGYVSGSSFFNYEWDSGKSCYLYRLPPSSRAAIEKARILD